MLSSRSRNSEAANSANIYGYHMDQGSVFTYVNGYEYRDIQAADNSPSSINPVQFLLNMLTRGDDRVQERATLGHTRRERLEDSFRVGTPEHWTGLSGDECGRRLNSMRSALENIVCPT